MARQSTASLSIIQCNPVVRQAIPEDLTADQAIVFRGVIDSKPANWFGADSVPLVKEYSRAVVACDLLARWVDKRMAAEANDLDKVIRMRDLESKRAMSLATKLRLTQQSRYTPQAAATAAGKAGKARPWES